MSKVKSSAKAHTSTIPDQEVVAPGSHEESASSDHESEKEVLFHPSRSQAPMQVLQNMFMPYIEGQKMDWTVNDSLYHRFLKWRLKCKNILECKLVALPEPQQCKKIIAWSGDFGMDQYVSWSLIKEELKLDTIWTQFEEFCKPQSNKLCARFDSLTSFHQGLRVLMSGIILCKHRSISQSTNQKQPRSCTEIYFGSSCVMRTLSQKP